MQRKRSKASFAQLALHELWQIELALQPIQLICRLVISLVSIVRMVRLKHASRSLAYALVE